MNSIILGKALCYSKFKEYRKGGERKQKKTKKKSTSEVSLLCKLISSIFASLDSKKLFSWTIVQQKNEKKNRKKI